MNKFIQNTDFCEVSTNKFSKKFGVKKGQVVYVAGHKALPISEKDPYTQRIKFFVHLFDHLTYKMGKELLLMDPASLKRLDDYDQENFLKEYKLANGID